MSNTQEKSLHCGVISVVGCKKGLNYRTIWKKASFFQRKNAYLQLTGLTEKQAFKYRSQQATGNT